MAEPLENNDGQLDLAFDGGDKFTIRGAPLSRNAAVVNVGLETKLADNWTARLDYQGDFGTETTRNTGFATVTWSW